VIPDKVQNKQKPKDKNRYHVVPIERPMREAKSIYLSRDDPRSFANHALRDNDLRTFSWILSFMVGFRFSALLTLRNLTRGLMEMP